MAGGAVEYLHRTARVLVAVLLAVTGGCDRNPGSGDAPGTDAVQAERTAAEEVLGSAVSGSLSVDVVRVGRLSRHLVQVELSLRNRGASPLDLPVLLSSPVGGLEQSVFRLASGDALTYVVRDGQGRPQCSTDLGTLPAGGAKGVFLRFMALSADAYAGTLEVPGLAPIGPLQVDPGT